MTTVTQNWMLDYEELPGCRLNLKSFRYFAVHPDKDWYYVGLPLFVNKLVVNGVALDLTGVVMPYPATNKAATAMAFTSRKLT